MNELLCIYRQATQPKFLWLTFGGVIFLTAPHTGNC